MPKSINSLLAIFTCFSDIKGDMSLKMGFLQESWLLLLCMMLSNTIKIVNFHIR